MRIYGIDQVRDECYAAAAVLTYWIFKCRDRAKTAAMGKKTWTYLESSIQNAAQGSTTIEDYVQRLSDKLVSHLRPAELTKIIQPEQTIYRIKRGGTEIEERLDDRELSWMGWHDLLEDIAPRGFTEWDVLELCRTKAAIIQVLCRLRFEEDRAIGAEEPEETIEVEAVNV
jgi:hypothetical protein